MNLHANASAYKILYVLLHVCPHTTRSICVRIPPERTRGRHLAGDVSREKFDSHTPVKKERKKKHTRGRHVAGEVLRETLDSITPVKKKSGKTKKCLWHGPGAQQ